MHPFWAAERLTEDGRRTSQDNQRGKGKESSAVADKGHHKLKRETANGTEARLS